MPFRTILLIFATFIVSVTGAKGETYFGDMNGDGKVTAQDSTLALRIGMGWATATKDQLRRGDVAPLLSDGSFGDGRLGINDVTRILRRSVGLDPDPWPNRKIIIRFQDDAASETIRRSSTIGAIWV